MSEWKQFPRSHGLEWRKRIDVNFFLRVVKYRDKSSSSEPYDWVVSTDTDDVMYGGADSLDQAKYRAEDAFKQWQRGKARMLFNPALAEKWDRMTRVQRISLLRIVGVLPEAVDHIANQPWSSVPFVVKMKLKWGWKENKAMKVKQNSTVNKNRAVAQTEIVRAFLSGNKKSLGTGRRMEIGGGVGDRGTRYKTDGKTLWVWGNMVASRTSGGIYITDAGWLTNLTRNVLNEILKQRGTATSVSTVRGKWKIWNYETQQTQDWTGEALIRGNGQVKLYDERGRPGIVFSGYTRRKRYVPPPPPPPPPPEPPKPRMLFNAGKQPKPSWWSWAEGRLRHDSGSMKKKIDFVVREYRRSFGPETGDVRTRLWGIASRASKFIEKYGKNINPRSRRKVRVNMHTQKERAVASKLFHRVYAIAYRAIQQKNWMLFAEKYGVMWGMWHAASLEIPRQTRLINSWSKAIDEIKNVAKTSGYPRL